MPYYPESLIQELEEVARQLRIESLRMIYQRQSGHPGGSLSAAEIVAALFFEHMHLKSEEPNWPERDRFLLSKGHASALLYSALARRGFIAPAELQHWGELTCSLQGHPDRLKTPGVEMTSGILGHGVAIGVGLALAARMRKQKHRVYVLLGDGECQGGIVWEGAMAAAKFRLANLTAIVDYNDVQLDGPVHEIMPVEPLPDKWAAFGWSVLQLNGHNVRQVLENLDMAAETHNRPTVLIAHTTKGKGVSYMENDSRWHGIAPNAEQFQQAMIELGGKA